MDPSPAQSLPTWEQAKCAILGASPQRPRPEVQAAGFRGPQAPLSGSCTVPPRNSPSTHCPSPHPDRTEQKQRRPEAWEQEGLGRTPPWSGEPTLGVPRCTEGPFLPF